MVIIAKDGISGTHAWPCDFTVCELLLTHDGDGDDIASSPGFHSDDRLGLVRLLVHRIAAAGDEPVFCVAAVPSYSVWLPICRTVAAFDSIGIAGAHAVLILLIFVAYGCRPISARIASIAAILCWCCRRRSSCR